ncbi:uncharacterized protein L201_003400 [Kwoniella dendrophila CBS 6074]|uniref:Uncharacterized protein n=1 Tax=Kwoniella dendrophila CBS 6074 TaxID=1295534 RepID=A0AAX4JU85_9TREE
MSILLNTATLIDNITKPSSSYCTDKSTEYIDIIIVSAPSSPSSSSYSTREDPDATPRPHPRRLTIPALTNEQLWEPWFAYPSRPQMTLHRWAEGNKSQLDMFIHNLPSSSPESLYPLFLTKCRSTLSALKVLVIGSILLIRGVNHGQQMGKILFGRVLGDRYNDLMSFYGKSSKFISRLPLCDDEEVIRKSVEEAKVLQIRANELFAYQKHEAALEHLGLAIIKLIPWDTASLSPEVAQRTGFAEIDQSLFLSIAMVSISISETLSPCHKSHLSIFGSRLYRLTKASCDYISYSPISKHHINQNSEYNDSFAETFQGKEEELAFELEKIASELAEMTPSSPSLSQENRDITSEKTIRNTRNRFEQAYCS